MSLEISTYHPEHMEVGIASNGVLRWHRDMCGEKREKFIKWCREYPGMALPTDQGMLMADDFLERYVNKENTTEPHTDAEWASHLRNMGWT